LLSCWVELDLTALAKKPRLFPVRRRKKEGGNHPGAGHLAEVYSADEPFAGIDPLAVADIQKIIEKLKTKGIGIIISDHNVRETLCCCDRAYIVNEGPFWSLVSRK
jgi:lipopolysaccharide export system ATP-binding protein